MTYSEQQQKANLAFFLHDLFDPVAQAVRSIDFLDASGRSYFSFAIVEAFLWLHLGVSLQYFSKPESRRATYEFANRLLAGYQHIVASKLLEKFSPPLKRILAAELSGDVELFSFVDELPKPSEELSHIYQTSLLLVGGFAGDPDAQQFLKMLGFANELTWRAATGRSLPSDIQQGDLQMELERLPRQWTRSGFFRVVQFMEASRQLRGDFDQTSTDFPEELKAQYLLLKRHLKEMQQWRLSFGDRIAQERFLEVARDSVLAVRSEVANGETSPNLTIDPDTLIGSINDLMTDWGGAPFVKGVQA